MTVEEMETDFWAHTYHDNPPKDEISDDDFDKDAELRRIEEEAEAAEAAAAADAARAASLDDYEEVINEQYQDPR